MMTLLANESNIDKLLREFAFYTTQEDKEFLAHTIQSIGMCAMRIPEVTERCMVQLMQLLSSKSEIVVAESIVVIKQLLQMPKLAEPTPKSDLGEDSKPAGEGENGQEKPEEPSQLAEVVRKLTRLFNKVTSPKARASIIWVVGEHVDKVATYAPDILRQMAKEFVNSDYEVKTQVLNLAAKLILTNPDQTALIAQYILNLAKFDLNYDIRDKSRLLRQVLMDAQGNLKVLHGNARRLLITKKPAPKIGQIASADRRFMIGSLSHVVHHTVSGYIAIPDWAKEPSDPELRKPADVYVSPLQSPGPLVFRDNDPGYKDLDSFLGNGESPWPDEDYEDYGEDYDQDFYGDDQYYEDGEYYEEGGEDFYGEAGGEGGEYPAGEGGEYPAAGEGDFYEEGADDDDWGHGHEGYEGVPEANSTAT